MSFIRDLLGEITGANAAAKGGVKAGAIQADYAGRGIDEISKSLSPWAGAGQAALGQQQDLLGLNGGAGQQSVIDMLLASPQFASLLRQGDESILQNASATGGLRGGNTISGLANFRTDLLSQLIEQQYGRLGSMSQQGLGASQAKAFSIADLLGQQGQALAGGQLAKSNRGRMVFQDALGMAKTAAAVAGGGGF